jgi:hypothetical protein
MKAKVNGCELVSGCDATTLLGLVGTDQVLSSIEMGLKQIASLEFRFNAMFAAGLLADKCPSPVGITCQSASSSGRRQNPLWRT